MGRNTATIYGQLHDSKWTDGTAVKAVPMSQLSFQPYELTAAVNGHSCIDFKPESHWLVFATQQNGHLELVHDCSGAVRVSPLLGPVLGCIGLIAQMEADFI